MHDNDFLKWRKFDWIGPLKRPNSDIPAGPPFLRASTDRFPRIIAFEDRLTFEDKLFLESVGIAV